MSNPTARKRQAEAQGIRDRGEEVIALAADIYVSQCAHPDVVSHGLNPDPDRAILLAEQFAEAVEEYAAEIAKQAAAVVATEVPE